MDKQHATFLLKKYSKGTATPQEIAILEEWYSKWGDDQIVLSENELAQVEKAIFSKLPKRKTKFPIYRYAAAAAILISIGIWTYFIPNENAKNLITHIQHKKNITSDVPPGKNIARYRANNEVS